MVAAGIKAARTRKLRAAGRKAAHTRKWNLTVRRAATTAKWAHTMTRWIVSRAGLGGAKWQLVGFRGPNGGESVGVVDILAIRKDHRPRSLRLKRGDCFDIVLIQVKGGGADWPTPKDIARLQQVAAHHNAKCIVLAAWRKGTAPSLFRLAGREWVLTTVGDAFG